jgi:hypothetical protein
MHGLARASQPSGMLGRMFGRSRRQCDVNECPHRGSRRYQVTVDGVVVLSAFLAKAIEPGQEIALCRRHLRSMVKELDLVEVLQSEPVDDY